MTSTPSTSDSQGGRIKGKTIVRPIVYGNTAKYFGEKRESDGHTHEWTIYLKPYFHEDMSKWVRKVVFKLHDSYQNSTRVIENPPYEVTETGWGEFECVIKIYFTDSQEKTVTAYHVLKLFHADPAANAAKKLVVSEYYDEIIFNDPTSVMLSSLQSAAKKTMIARHDTDLSNVLARNAQLILDAQGQVRSEITDLRESLKEAQHLLNKYREDLPKYERQSEENMMDENSHDS